MNTIQQAVAYIVEKAESEKPELKVELYRMVADLTPDDALANELLIAANLIEGANAAQLRLKLQLTNNGNR